MVADFVAVFERRPEVGAVIIPGVPSGKALRVLPCAREEPVRGRRGCEAPVRSAGRVFDATGGWDETLTAAEDWDLADRPQKALGVIVDRIDSLIWYDEGRIQLHVTYSKKQYYGRWVAEYLSRHPEGRAHLARSGVLKQAGTLAKHPVKASGPGAAQRC